MSREKSDIKSLLKKAEDELKKNPELMNTLSGRDTQALIHDLKVHQIELEMQNEELRRTQKELEKTKNIYAGLYNQAPMGYVSLDSNGIIIKSNQTFAEMTGEEVSSIHGKGFVDFLSEESRRIFLGRYNAFFKNPEGKSMDVFIRKGGTESAARINGKQDTITSAAKEDEKGKRDLLLLIITDICEQKKIEEALQESEKRYRTLFENAGDAIMIHDYQGRILEVNGVACERLVYAKEEFAGLHLTDIDANQFLEKINERLKELMEKKYLVFESDHKSKTGKIIPVEISCREIEYKGEPAVLSISRDITERREADEKIRSLLTDKEILLKEVHHRIKNNMNTIAGLLYIQAETLNDASGAAAIQDARNRVLIMMNLYDRLYRSSDFRNVSTDEYLNALIDEISFSYSDTNGITIEREFDDFVIDSKLLFPAGMIINELISNAVKYAFPSGSGGVIRVYFTRPVRNLVSLIVSDDGVGLPEGLDLENSTGFGLNLVHMLVTQLKGSADIMRSNGTIFRITFPLEVE